MTRTLLWTVTLAFALTLAACLPPAAINATKQPRPGRAVGRKVAVVYSKHYQISLGGLEKLHPFDIRKYARIYLKLNTDGLLRPEDVFVPKPVTKAQILLVHSPAFLKSLSSPRVVARYLEAPYLAAVPAPALDAGVLAAFRSATGGTIEAARQAMACGVAVNLAGGYHHAHRDAGEGFNVYNDLAIAARVLQKARLARRVLVVDLDVHQGNGTARIFAADDAVYTFSMHEGGIYPVPKATSDRDVELPAHVGDKAYLQTLAKHLPAVLAAAKPDLVLYQAGCDTLAGDPLAHLTMTPGGIVQRDAMVIDACVQRGIPVAMTLGGGYSKNAWQAQYQSVARTIRTYGLQGWPAAHPRRRPTVKERIYTK